MLHRAPLGVCGDLSLPPFLQSQAHHGFRRASDSLIAVRPPQKFVKHSPMLPAHRERAAQLVPDTTISAANIAKKIGKGGSLKYITCLY